MVSLFISLPLGIVWHSAMLAKLAACGIQGQLLTGLLTSRIYSQHAALNAIFSSPLPVEAGVLQSGTYINYLSNALETFYSFWGMTSHWHVDPNPTDTQTAAMSLC